VAKNKTFFKLRHYPRDGIIAKLSLQPLAFSLCFSPVRDDILVEPRPNTLSSSGRSGILCRPLNTRFVPSGDQASDKPVFLSKRHSGQSWKSDILTKMGGSCLMMYPADDTQKTLGIPSTPQPAVYHSSFCIPHSAFFISPSPFPVYKSPKLSADFSTPAI